MSNGLRVFLVGASGVLASVASHLVFKVNHPTVCLFIGCFVAMVVSGLLMYKR